LEIASIEYFEQLGVNRQLLPKYGLINHRYPVTMNINRRAKITCLPIIWRNDSITASIAELIPLGASQNRFWQKISAL
jgi:hypothetical protein